MHPVLLRTETFAVGSYAVMMLAAAVLAVVTAALRARHRHLDPAPLAVSLIAAMVGGSVGARFLPLALAGQAREFQWASLLPGHPASPSLSGFLLVALPIVLLCLLPRRRQVQLYLDALAPSLLIGLAVAKIGCFLAGCCAGDLCPARCGVRYPYGSDVYADQWRARLVHPPAPLVRTDPGGPPRLLGHADTLLTRHGTPGPTLRRQAAEHGLPPAALADRLGRERSLPAWPVPLWYTAAAGVLWAIAEIRYRRGARTGWACGFVLVTYAALRLTLDGFVPAASRPVLHLSPAQLLALPVGAIGAALLLCNLLHERDESRDVPLA